MSDELRWYSPCGRFVTGYAHTDDDRIGRPPLLEPTDPYWRAASKRLLDRLAALRADQPPSKASE